MNITVALTIHTRAPLDIGRQHINTLINNYKEPHNFGGSGA
jgi:hypothetical protein